MGSGKRVKIDVYAFSKCPYYIDLEEEIVRISPDLDALYDLNLHFFGRVDSTERLGFSCLHGESECLGNFASLCAIHLTNNNRSQWLRFTQCENEDYRRIPANQDSCATQAGLELVAFHRCIAETAPGLFGADSRRAETLGVPGSPTVFVNDVRTHEDLDLDASALDALICNASAAYPLPSVCHAKNTRTTVFIVIACVAAVVAVAVVVVVVVVAVVLYKRKKKKKKLEKGQYEYVSVGPLAVPLEVRDIGMGNDGLGSDESV